MSFKRFFYLAFCISITFVFAKIYQYNQFVRYSYLKQRLEAKRDSFLKDKDSLLVDLFKIKNQAHIIQYAKNDLGFKSIDPSSIIKMDEQDTK